MSMDWKEQDRRGDAPQGDKTKVPAALILWVIVAALAITFILQNTRDSTVTFLFWDRRVSIWIAIVVAIVLGVLLDRLAGWFFRRRRNN
jgi:uncharacterized integral membrane protein